MAVKTVTIEDEWSEQEAEIRQRYADLKDRTAEVRKLTQASSTGADGFAEMMDISWIFHENGLEGVVLTYPEIKSAVDNRIVSDVALLATYTHIKDQKKCIDEVRAKAKQSRGNITVEMLQQMHDRLIGEKEETTYRKDIPIHRTYFHEIAQPKDIIERLEGVVDYLKGPEAKTLHPIEFAAKVHHKYMRVFPFSKFSGFTGRLLLNFVLERHELFPVVIHATDRQKYYEALRGPEKDFRLFLLYTMESGIKNAARFLEAESRSRRRA